jgi:putative DNA primase/helicase
LRAELPGIFNWALGGCVRYQKEGLNPPESVIFATKQYEHESDVVGLFLEAETEKSPMLWTKSSVLYARCCKFCEENGLGKISSIAFGTRMKEKGFKKEIMEFDRTISYRGIILREG